MGVAVFAWAMIASAWQGGWSGFVEFWWLYGILSAVLIASTSLYTSFRSGPVSLLAAFFSGFGVLWLTHAGSFLTWRTALLDGIALVIAAGFTFIVMQRFTRWRFPRAADWSEAAPPHWKRFDLVVFGFCAWFAVSAVSAWATRPLPVDATRFARLGPARSIVPEHAQDWQGLQIGLALSGGGYRAAVYHAGVLQALEDLGVRVTHLSTVSGGSIIGAYYAIGGDPADFPPAVTEGRFNLKRRLMLMQNAVCLPFPFKVPGLDVELIPWYRFDRLDAQRELLEDLLLANSPLRGGLSAEEPALGQPALMVAVTDLTYGFQLGLLPDGMLKLGNGASERAVFRGRAYEPASGLSLAERVTYSGAFPLAFPSRAFPVRVHPPGATGRGLRELQLVDGGLRDNTGFDLLRAAQALADPGSGSDHSMSLDWNLDAAVVSDGGAVVGVFEDQGGATDLLSRMFEVAGIRAEHPGRNSDECGDRLAWPTAISPALQYLPANTQFNLHNDGGTSEEPENVLQEWTLAFDPSHYPEPVLRRLLGLLPADEQEAANTLALGYREKSKASTITSRDWSRALAEGRSRGECRSTVPGVCEALALRAILRRAVVADLEVFRSVSTLDDTPEEDTVESLERLGKILTYLRWPSLKASLDKARTCRQAADPATARAPAVLAPTPKPPGT